MTLKEAREIATQGPFGFSYKSAKAARKNNPGTDGGGSTGCITVGKDKLYGPDVLAYMRINRIPKDDERHRIDAALLVHCANHFDQVVNVLEEVLELWEKGYATEEVTAWRRANAVLDAAKKVKI